MSAGNPLAALTKLRQPTRKPSLRTGERCELCGEPVPDEHGHLVDLHQRALACACRGCYLLFTEPGAGGRYQIVPERFLSLPGFALSPAQWDALQVPVDVAFFFINSELDRVAAFYPSPAGATESLLALDAWAEIAAAHPALSTLAPDTEAFLVRGAGRRAGGRTEGFVVPIAACYELVGHLRRHWSGFDGGSEAHAAIAEFFDRIRAKAKPFEEPA